MPGLAFIAMVSLLAGLLIFFSAVNNQPVTTYTKKVLKL